MFSIDTLLYAAPAVTSLVLLHYYQKAARDKLCYPPSPKSFPLLGNLLSIPPGLEHEAYMKLGEQLNSDIVYLALFGHNIVVLNSAEAASDLFEKRSAIYSDRYCPPMIGDPRLLNWGNHPSLLGYNDLWRHYRRMMNNWLNARAIVQFHHILERETQLLLKRLLDASTRDEPFERLGKEFLFAIASSLFELTYGYHLQDNQDRFFANAELAIEHTAKAGMFTNFFVNIFPALAFVPDWFPDTGWKRTAQKWRAQKDQAINEPYQWTKAQVAAGNAEPSILSALLQDNGFTRGLSPEERDGRLTQLAMAVYGGGTETTSKVLGKFIAAMVMNPEVQAKAQNEIDTVLGPASLPRLADRERLPYLNNLILELLRWHPVAPTGGLPHACSQDDVYRGYKIEKGTIVIGNIWAMSRDPTVYKNPESFNPDRFLDSSVPPLPSFGWGRRKCPGVYLSEASVFVVVASLLATFTFSKKRDELGEEIVPKIEGATNSITVGLKPFEFELKPRSEKHRRIILDSV